MTTLISQYSSSSNMITSSDSNPIQTNSSSSTSTRFSLSLPIDTTTTTKSNNYILKSTSLISALISPHHHHHHHSNHQESNQSNHPHQINTNLLQQPDQTLSSSSASSINHKNRLPRPRALSSSHLPPPFPSPSGTFLPPPSTHYLPLKLPSHSDRKSRTNHPSRSNSNTINGHLDGENQEGLKTSKVHHHRRSSSLQTLPTLHRSEEAHQTRKRSASSTMMDSSRIPNSNLIPKHHHHPILIRDFGFPLTDDRHYKTIHTEHMKAHARNPRDSMNTDGLEERFQSSLSLPPEEEEEEEEEGRVGCKKANLWTTTMSSERPGMTEDETEEEDEDGLREEIERRRESLDKSLQSIGRPSIGSGLDSSDLEEEEAEEEEEEEEEGLWVALYDFVAEGEGEMGIYEGEILRVCKVVCDGWVIARKVPGELDEDGRFVEKVLGFEKPQHSLDDEIEQQQENDDDQMGLCPQNYLARI